MKKMHHFIWEKLQLAFLIWHCDKSGQQLFPHDVKAVWINVQEIQYDSYKKSGPAPKYRIDGTASTGGEEVTGQQLKKDDDRLSD